MEDELWRKLYPLVEAEAKRKICRKRCQYSDATIVRVFFWAVLHDRPVSWACRSEHWPPTYRWMQLPSQPTMSLRLRTLSVAHLIMAVYQRLQQVPHLSRRSLPPLCRCIDSKPLVVGGFSKDKDARRGYATGGMARGYKLFTIWGKAVVPDAFALGPLNQADCDGAAKLVSSLQGCGYLLADAVHDVNALHALYSQRGFQLVSPRHKPGTNLGHRSHAPGRLRSLEMLEGPSPFGRSLYPLRGQIERHYGQWTSFGGGLQPLPSWVRHPRRVAQWVLGKLILNGLRICINHGLAA